MKFDLIVSNPPYGGLDLKILENVLSLSDKICIVHPTTWLLDNKDKSNYKSLRNKVENRLHSIELYNSSEIFGIGYTQPVSINFIDNELHTSIKVIDNSKYASKKDEEYLIKTLEDFDKWAFSTCYKTIKNKILSENNFLDKIGISGNFYLKIPAIRGDQSPYKYTILGLNSYVTDTKVIKGQTQWIGFDSKEKAINCEKYLRTKFARFCLSILRNNVQLSRGELKSIPWFDFSKPWTDEEAAKELGITNEELLWMIQQIPDYYPEDAETYRKLEEKLSKKEIS